MLENASILVVDDEADLCDMLGFEFEMQGSHVFYAYDGEAAFDILNAQNVDVVITDIRMPRANGMELLERIRARDEAHPAVVFITAYDTTLSLREAFYRGAEGFFAKPFRLKDLVQRVETVLEQPQSRWNDRPVQPAAARLEQHYPDLATARASRRFDIGRGGFAAHTNDLDLTPGNYLDFTISFDNGPLPLIEGTGAVCWTARYNDSGQTVLGVEFAYLSGQSKQGLLPWLERCHCRPYIPQL